ncbi:hypothetical protein EJ05DRAFT_513050 [Pseudovirgaria hyperparasitica]|uniref:Uncharacterized protein n=1 Tax=Pseudovirgaria hyperparasitica TaxID=470096 RepID=A0A6A6W3D7_9PEZI|nr:uncharacterized protein EJ05DRAFT_513050 [Pseudovirgaria hyperparasitica]KAF2755551.1 hypothetical protein EJ05DRAFT_513050 [Pseudovirgaria hyperparasitica]
MQQPNILVLLVAIMIGTSLAAPVPDVVIDDIHSQEDDTPPGPAPDDYLGGFFK